MNPSITFKKKRPESIKSVIVLSYEDGLGKTAKAVDKGLKGLISQALKNSPNFKSKNGQVLVLSAPEKSDYEHVIVLGLGKKSELTAIKAEEAGGKLYAAISKSGAKNAAILTDEAAPSKSLSAESLAAHIANGIILRGYEFTRYKSQKKGDKKPVKLEKLSVVCEHAANAKKLFEDLHNVTQGVYLARDLVNTAPNDLYPESYAKIIKDELKPLGVDVEIIDEKKMQKLGMGAILAVGKGSERQPRMVIMRWNGGKKKDKPLGFVGKGVTFDTGGISLKPGPGMDEMKMDMGGSAAVVGLMKSLALRKAKTNVVGVVGLAENMPSSNAYRPGDILTSYSGQTIEVLNTDAEGRLVLSDCLTHIQKEHDPEFIVDLATLTGAMMVALGHEYCGTFVNNDKLWKNMEKSSASTGEKLWRMPLDEAWTKEMESGVADIQNLGKSRYAGACTAAAFLGYFIDKDRPWAHMDIAGTAWKKSDKPTVPKYGSGFGVRVLDNLVAEYYES